MKRSILTVALLTFVALHVIGTPSSGGKMVGGLPTSLGVSARDPFEKLEKDLAQEVRENLTEKGEKAMTDLIGKQPTDGPLGIRKGSPLKPQKGWNGKERGVEEREYKGRLPFDFLLIEGTSGGGACSVQGHNPDATHKDYAYMLKWLEDKYRKPIATSRFQGVEKAHWLLNGNPEGIEKINLVYFGRSRGLMVHYVFDNRDDCTARENP